MRWHTSKRHTLGGFWECYPKMVDRKKRYWHRTGYIVRRKTDLRAQRERVLIKLDELRQEAEDSRDS